MSEDRLDQIWVADSVRDRWGMICAQHIQAIAEVVDTITPEMEEQVEFLPDGQLRIFCDIPNYTIEMIVSKDDWGYYT